MVLVLLRKVVLLGNIILVLLSLGVVLLVEVAVVVLVMFSRDSY